MMLHSIPVKKITNQMLDPYVQPHLNVCLPLDKFPAAMAGMIEYVACQHSAAQELCAANALLTATIATLGQANVQIPRTEHTEPSTIYLIACAASGERKTSVYNSFASPLMTWEDTQRQEYEDQKLQYEANRKILEVKKKKTTRELIRTNNKEDSQLLFEELKSIEIELSKQPDRCVKQLVISHNTTLIAIIKQLEDNGGVGAILSDEGDLSFLLKNHELAEFFRNAYSGGRISVTRSRGDISIAECRFSYGCITQFPVLANLGRLKDQHEYGSIARLLCIIAPSQIGQRIYRNSIFQDKPEIPKEWNEKITRIANTAQTLVRSGEKRVLTLNDHATGAWDKFRFSLEERIDYGDLIELRSWASKAVGGVLRFSGIFHFFENPDLKSVTISSETVNNAINIYEWLIDHAKVANALMFPRPGVKHAYRILEYLIDTRPFIFSAGQLINRLKHNSDKTSDWYSGLQLLEDIGYVQVKPYYNLFQQRGRPKKEYTITQFFTDSIRQITGYSVY